MTNFTLYEIIYGDLQVAEQLSELIRSGQFDKGQNLPPERELARQFSVSRPTIREAITTLEVMGLVEVRPGSGVYVLESGTSNKILPANVPGPFEILEARKTLEPELAAFAANRIDDTQLEELRLKSLANWREEEIEKAGPMGIWDALAQQIEKLVERLEK